MSDKLYLMVWEDPNKKGNRPSVEKQVSAETAVKLLTGKGMSKGWKFKDKSLELVENKSDKGITYSIEKKKAGQ